MDPILKQRLTGAIVISSLAVIFVPMLFDDPIVVDDGAVIEIPQLPEEVNVAVEPISEILVDTIDEKQNALQSEKTIATIAEKPSDSENKQAMISWLIQVGSFSNRDNANGLVEKLKKAEFAAFVETTTEQGKDFFRVRVGPALDRQRAEQQRKEIEQKFDVKSIIISSP